MRKSLGYSLGILIVLAILLGWSWIFADREKKSVVPEKMPLRGEGKSVVVQGILQFESGRWTLQDQSTFFQGQRFIFLENFFLEEVLQNHPPQTENPLIFRGRYHFFQGQSYLLPTHLHSKEEVIFPEKS